MYNTNVRAYKITVDHMTNKSILDLLIKIQFLTDYTWNVKEYMPRKVTTLIFNINSEFITVMDIPPYLLIDCDIVENTSIENAISGNIDIARILPT